jgi:glucosamine-6-phosphate deaminase
MEVIIKSDYESICEEACSIIQEEWEKKRDLVLGLATGDTPLGVYRRLILKYQKGEMDFSEIRTFNLDEYLGLEENNPRSYACYMDHNLFSHINVRKENIHRLKGNPHDIDEHCRSYEEAMRSCGGIDIQLLGIGRNGHIGFNEPCSSLSSRTRVKTLTKETIDDNTRTFPPGERVPHFVLTMGIGTVMEARLILLLASGTAKSRALYLTVEGPVTASVPGSILQLHPNVKLIVDEESSSLLTRRDYYKFVYENKWRVRDFIT